MQSMDINYFMELITEQRGLSTVKEIDKLFSEYKIIKSTDTISNLDKHKCKKRLLQKCKYLYTLNYNNIEDTINRIKNVNSQQYKDIKSIHTQQEINTTAIRLIEVLESKKTELECGMEIQNCLNSYIGANAILKVAHLLKLEGIKISNVLIECAKSKAICKNEREFNSNKEEHLKMLNDQLEESKIICSRLYKLLKKYEMIA